MHRKKLRESLNPPHEERKCSYPKGATCLLGGQCLETQIVYQATVTHAGGPDENYIGLTAPNFKLRLGNHKKLFNHFRYEKDSELSKHVWKIKRKNEDYDIKWKIIEKLKSFNPVTNICNLCTTEKYHIIFNSEQGSLNKRDEIKSHCRHKKTLLLDNT